MGKHKYTVIIEGIIPNWQCEPLPPHNKGALAPSHTMPSGSKVFVCKECWAFNSGRYDLSGVCEKHIQRHKHEHTMQSLAHEIYLKGIAYET